MNLLLIFLLNVLCVFFIKYILDLVFSCLGKEKYNPYFYNVSFKINDKLTIIIISFFFIFDYIFSNNFYSFFLK